MQLSSLLTLALSLALASAAPSHRKGALKAVSAITDFPIVATLQASIEGVSVDAAGNLYCIDANSFNNLSSSSVVWSRPGLNTTAMQFAGSRHTRTHGVLLTEVVRHAVVSLPTPLCNTTDLLTGAPTFTNAANTWKQPNDLAVGAGERAFYFSGMNYTAGTGDLWWSPAPAAHSTMPLQITLPAAVARTNGIEVVGNNLYLTSAENTLNGTDPATGAPVIVVSGAKVYRIPLDPSTGAPLPEQASVAKDYYADVPGAREAQMDPDGMRADVDGWMYATLNAYGRVLRWNTKRPSEQQVIELPTVNGPSNLELGGKDGKTLVVVGGCKKGLTGLKEGQVACVDKVEGLPAAGRAWSMLQEKKTGY
ncbi:hypothetical protein EDC01DRAFT_672280 [Geopyxis carbonaria]|nr:hypothetical protein EDC01DRAFT_672280 [Geopyxis carbonaria]